MADKLQFICSEVGYVQIEDCPAAAPDAPKLRNCSFTALPRAWAAPGSTQLLALIHNAMFQILSTAMRPAPAEVPREESAARQGGEKEGTVEWQADLKCLPPFYWPCPSSLLSLYFPLFCCPSSGLTKFLFSWWSTQHFSSLCKCPHSVPEDTFHPKPDTSPWMTLLLSVLHKRASSETETYMNLCKFYLYLAAVLTTFLAAPAVTWQGKHPNAWCNPSEWQAHLFCFIFLECSLSLGDQHCSISCFSAPVRRIGELFYLHIRKNRWKMALCAFHSAFSLKFFLICWAFPSQNIVFTRKILSLLNEPFHKIEKRNGARLWSSPVALGRKWLWFSHAGERDTFSTSLGAADLVGEPSHHLCVPLLGRGRSYPAIFYKVWARRSPYLLLSG